MKNYKMIEDYFDKLGIIDINDPEVFWMNLEEKLGENFCDRIDNAMSYRDITKSDDVYSIKNESFKTSLEFVTYSKDLYRNYLKGLIDLNLSPKKILDIGCDNGIVTCMYAILYPDAEIIGIDIGVNGINRSKELAEHLGLTNVKFEKFDFKKIKNLALAGEFDLITSVRSVKEILMLFDEHRVWDLYEIEKIKTKKSERIAFENLANLLCEDGILILFERLASIEEIIYFNKIVKESGYKVVEEYLKYIELQELGDVQKMPFMVYKKNQDSNVENDTEILLNAFLIEDMKEFNNFMKLEAKELIYGIQINYSDGSGNMREELYKAEDKLAYIKYSNIGYKEISVSNNNNYNKNKVVKEIKDDLEFYKKCWCTVIEYENLEQRPQ